MPSWSELVNSLEAVAQKNGAAAIKPWMDHQLDHWLEALSRHRGNRNVIVYASGFLQKPMVPSVLLQIMHEDVNGFMSVMKGMKWEKNLTLVLHTPGGVTNATESVVEYLLHKFTDIEVIIPTYAMSAGTMISLAADRLVMGRQSQLGPIDPQMPINNRTVSARAIVDQFKTARDEISGDQKLAVVWAPILQHLGPALLREANDALEYSESMVARWLQKRLFANHQNPEAKARAVAQHFNRSEINKSHGRRIDREEARSQDLVVENLEDDQQLQEIVLTLYHLVTIVFDRTPCVKFMARPGGVQWLKNLPLVPRQPGGTPAP